MKKLFFIFLSVALLALSGCGKRADDAGAEPAALSIGLMPDIDSVPFIVAREKGFFAEEGVSVQLVQFKSAIDRDAAMQSESLDGAVSDMLAAAFYKAGGFDVRITSATNGSYLMAAGKGSGVASVPELSGKEIAVSRNTIIEYVTDEMIEGRGVSPDSVKKTAIPQIPVRLEMLRTGKLAAATLPEPMASLAANGGCQIIASSDEMGLNPGVMIFTAKAAEKRELLKAMYRAYNKSVRYLRETPRAEYIGFVVEKSGFPKEALDVMELPAYGEAALPTEKDVAAAVSWMSKKGLIKESFSYNDLVARDALP